SGVFTFGYDQTGRLTSSTTPYGVINYVRDGLGRVTSRQVVGQPAVTYTYDLSGNLTQAALPQAAATLSYNARNQLSSISRLNGVTSSFTYDPAARLLALTHSKAATTIDAETYSYDPIGNRLSHSTSMAQSLSTPATSNQFDAANELTQRSEERRVGKGS